MVVTVDNTCSLGGITYRLLLALLTICGMALGGTAQAQYGYYDAYGNLVGYPSGYDYYGNPLPYGVQPGYGYPQGYGMPGYGMGGVDPIQQQMDALQQQIDAQVLLQLQPFITYYREATGDYQTPDAMAAEYGMNLWCTNFPVECQRALNTTSPEAAAWMAQSNANHQQNMAQRQAGFDAWMQGVQSNSAAQEAAHNAWMDSQAGSYEANQAWIQGVIWGEGNYTNPVTGATMSLPFAPAPGTTYLSPNGNQMVFDPSTNTWREVGGGATFHGQ